MFVVIDAYMMHVDAAIALTLPDRLEDRSAQDGPLFWRQLPPVKYGRLGVKRQVGEIVVCCGRLEFWFYFGACTALADS